MNLHLIFIFLISFASLFAFAQTQNIDDMITAGKDAIASGNLDEANIYFERVLEIDPENVSALNNLSNNYIRLNNFEQAEIFLDKLLNIVPNHVNSLINKGTILVQDDKNYESLKYFYSALELEPNAPLVQAKIDDAKSKLRYKLTDGMLEIIVRDPDGNLAGYLKTDKNFTILTHEVGEEIKYTWPVKKIVTRDGQKYEVRQGDLGGIIDSVKFLGQFGMGLKPLEDVYIIFVHYHGYVANVGDSFTYRFTIYVPVE